MLAVKTFIIVLFIIVGIVVIGLLCYVGHVSRRQQIEEVNEENDRILQNQRDFEQKILSIKEKYGNITVEIEFKGRQTDWEDLKYKMLIFEDTQIAYIQEKVIPFKNILAYTLTDNQQIVSTTMGSEDIKTSLGSIAGRALVGGVLLGGVGALAGAVTAKKDIEINTTTQQTTTHNYLIYLNIDNLANPQMILEFGEDGELANKTASVFNIIINRNK